MYYYNPLETINNKNIVAKITFQFKTWKGSIDFKVLGNISPSYIMSNIKDVIFGESEIVGHDNFEFETEGDEYVKLKFTNPKEDDELELQDVELDQFLDFIVDVELVSYQKENSIDPVGIIKDRLYSDEEVRGDIANKKPVLDNNDGWE